MSTELTWQTTCTGSEATVQLGENLGLKLRGGEVIELVSDVGGGKTTLVRGIVKGFGSSDTVASPSFTISRQYSAGDKTIYHFDFYRLQDPGVLAAELAEFLEDDRAIVIVEWADIVEDILPIDRLQIRITAPEAIQRHFDISYPAKLQYLIPEKT